jgi:hypothetical protein
MADSDGNELTTGDPACIPSLPDFLFSFLSSGL